MMGKSPMALSVCRGGCSKLCEKDRMKPHRGFAFVAVIHDTLPFLDGGFGTGLTA